MRYTHTGFRGTICSNKTKTTWKAPFYRTIRRPFSDPLEQITQFGSNDIHDNYNIITLWLFNIAPFIDYFPIKTSIYKGFSMAMLNNQMVYNRDLHVRLNQFIRIPLHLIPSFFHGQNIREHRGNQSPLFGLKLVS